MKYTNKTGTWLFFIAVFAMIVYALYKRDVLRRNFKLSSAVVTECSLVPKTGGSISIRYTYKVDTGWAYNDNYIDAKLDDCKNYFVGKTFPVAYSPDDKYSSIILISPEDFKSFNYQYPDSLKWVLNYLR